jgi:putative glycosyltransferase (TIGR04372 family)
MAEFLAGCGYVVLRMGQIVKTAFKSTNPNVIDYANSSLRSDFADVFLFSTCSFCISTSTGMDALASIFRIPTGLVNVVSTDSVALGELVRIFQPKQFIDQLTGRALTYKEILHRNLSAIYRTSDFVRYGINLIENTPEDLRLFAEELLGILALEGVVHGRGNEIRPTPMYGAVKKERMDKLSKSWLRNHQNYMK